MSDGNRSETDRIRLMEEPDHLNYVRKIAWHYYAFVPNEKRGLITIEDLISAGYEGLAIAAGKYKPERGVKFTTYSSRWIKGEIIREMIFYIGRDALLIDNATENMLASQDRSVENRVTDDSYIDAIPEEEQIRIIRKKLREYKLTKEEIAVYMAVNGIGCDRVTNMRGLARQMNKREMEIRRIRQSAEDKMKRIMY